MVAVFMVAAHGGVSWGSVLLMLTVVPLGLLWAPQPVRVRVDKRVLVAGGVLIGVFIASTVFAAPTKVCEWAWWAIECWLF